MAVTGKAEKFSFPRRNSNPNFIAAKRNAEWNFSDVQSDIIIDVDGVNFSLHKFPLLARSGRIRKLAGEWKESDHSGPSPVIEFSNFPGGPDTFELAAKFCYGINFDITTANVACLRCAAEYLEMTEDYGEENLISRTEVFLREVVLQSVEKSAEVLHSCEGILQLAEEVKVVNRCIDAVASKVCQEQMVASLSRLDCNSSWRSNNRPHGEGGGGACKAVVEWWAEDLSSLRVDLFQRTLAAMKSRGIRNESLGGSLMHYAQRALQSFSSKNPQQQQQQSSSKPPKLWSSASRALEHEQRTLLETIVSLLPAEKNIFPTNFLLSLLRTSIVLDTTVACRLDLERRIGTQLEQATVDDLLIPSLPHAGEAVFDVDVVQRVLVSYLQQEDSHEQLAFCESDHDLGSPPQRGIMKVAKLIDLYLAEIAPDANLKVSKFTALAEQLPDYARVLDDGLYRAIDIFLKAHPTLSDMERKKLCKVLDCQKMSQEACAHAAQNERLPVQLVVQVLYFEQLRMRNAIAGPSAIVPNNSSGSNNETHHHPQQQLQAFGSRQTPHNNNRVSAATSPRIDSSSHLRRENRELKLEVARMRLRVDDLEKENAALKEELQKPGNGAAVSGGFFSSFSRRLGKLNPFASSKARDASSSGKHAPENRATPRRRRHSIS